MIRTGILTLQFIGTGRRNHPVLSIGTSVLVSLRLKVFERHQQIQRIALSLHASAAHKTIRNIEKINYACYHTSLENQ